MWLEEPIRGRGTRQTRCRSILSPFWVVGSVGKLDGRFKASYRFGTAI